MFVFSEYTITSPYGSRKDPITASETFHTGIDLVKSDRAPIPAFVEGIVVHAKEGAAGSGFGNFGIVVAIRDRNGALHCYAHLSSVRVQVGERVMAGQIIGIQGSTGRSTASHLHFEIRLKASPSFGYGTHTDPALYLDNYGQQEGGNDMQVDLAGKVIKVIQGAWGLAKTKKERDELHQLANEVRKASGLPLQ